MTVTVLRPEGGTPSRLAAEDVYAEGQHIYAFDGHLAVATSNVEEDGHTIALYAPGTWTSAHIDEHRKQNSPPGLGARRL